MKIMAGIVLYNPNIERLIENIQAIITQVDHVVMVDNCSENFPSVCSTFAHYDNISYINNTSNYGIAFALKQIMEYGQTCNFDWVLTLDQDSVCQPGLINEYLKWANLDKVGILTCNIIDRSFIQETGFDNSTLWRAVKQCITSASLINTLAYSNTDGFNERLFIDSVDFDMRINMRLYGYRIIKINFNGLYHEVGHGRNVKLLTKDYIIYNHSPFRHYYMARNHWFLLEKYPKEFSRPKEMMRELRDELLVLIYEKQKFSKLKSRWKGLLEAKKITSLGYGEEIHNGREIL